MQEFVALCIFVFLSFCFASASIIAAFIVSPKTKNPEKISHYECGLNIDNVKNIQYNARFFMYGLLFLIFDIETILLYPFAMAYNQLGIFAFIEVTIFVLIITLGLIYAIKKNMLRWK